MPDGRFIVTTIPGLRFEIQQKTTKESMHYAKVKYFCDVPDLNNDMFNTASRRTYDHLVQYVSSHEKDGQSIKEKYGPLPQYESNFSLFPNGPPWIWWGLAVIPLNCNAKLVLLKSNHARERMLSLERFLRFLS